MSTSIQDRLTVESQGKLLQQVEMVYRQIARRIGQKANYTVSQQLFHEYHQRISNLIGAMRVESQKSLGQEEENSEQVEDNDAQPYEIVRQSPYTYLRRAWQRKSSYSMIGTLSYDPQDHIDSLSKTVAMLRQQTAYMARKQNYLYQKDQSNHFLLNENPLFISIKQQLQASQLQKKQCQKRCSQQAQVIERLNKDKLLLEKSLKSLKKRLQQMEKSWIEVSKRSITLEQELLGLRERGSKGRVTLQQKDTINSNKSTQASPDTLRPLQNFFMDIKYNKSDYCQSPKANIVTGGGNNGDVENKVNSDDKKEGNNGNKNHSMVESSIADANEVKQYKHFRHQPSTRSTLLSSTRSVDLSTRNSTTKPKFERTKPNIKQTLLKSFTKDDSTSITIDKPPVLIKNQSSLNDQSTTLIKRSFISKRKQVK